MVAASKPRMVCRIIGARMPGSIAGCAQANISSRRWSGICVSLATAGLQLLAINCRWGAASSLAAPPPRRIDASCGAPPSSATPPGSPGMPLAGQSTRAAAKASDKASSAPATSRGARRQKGDQLAVAAAGHRFGGRARGLSSPSCGARADTLHDPERAHLDRRRDWRPGSAPPTTARHRDRARRSCSSRPVAPWSPHRARPAPRSCRWRPARWCRRGRPQPIAAVHMDARLLHGLRIGPIGGHHLADRPPCWRTACRPRCHRSAACTSSRSPSPRNGRASCSACAMTFEAGPISTGWQ